MVAITIAAESPLQDELREMIAALNAHLRPLSPPEFQFQMTVEQMAEPETTVLVARDDHDRAVGTGSLKTHGDGLGEIKRMFTLPDVRGQRVGAQLLEALVDLARDMDLNRLVLETGVGDGFVPAWRLYERGGFSRCGAVLDYPDSGWSAFFEMELSQADTAIETA